MIYKIILEKTFINIQINSIKKYLCCFFLTFFLTIILPIVLLSFSLVLLIPPNPLYQSLNPICSKLYTSTCIKSNYMLNYSCNNNIYEFACVQTSSCMNLEVSTNYLCFDQSQAYNSLVQEYNLELLQYPVNMILGTILLCLSIFVLFMIILIFFTSRYKVIIDEYLKI